MKTILITMAAIAMCSTVAAQGFSSFKSDATIVDTYIKDRGEKASIVETIVLDNCDITNLPVKYKLWSGCSIDAETPLTANYSKPQTVKITKSGEETKIWDVVVHQLKAASLPANISFSAQNPCDLSFTNPKPWATYSLDFSQPDVVRMSNEGSAFYVAYDGKAKELTFDVQVLSNDPFGGELNVETSVDGKKWSKVTTYSASNPFKGKTQTLALPGDARFIRWNYAVRNKQNIHLNNILIQ